MPNANSTVMKQELSGALHYNLYIGGRWVRSASDATIEVENPATEETIAVVPDANGDDVQLALEAAQRAQPEWSRLPGVQRGEWLLKLADIVRQNRETLAQAVTREQGKPLAQAGLEVDSAVRRFDYFARWGRHLEGDILPAENPDETIFIHRVPFGVVAGIAAWNFPVALFARKVAPAIIAGNTIVVKPSELTPTSALELAQLVHEVGFPPGVINVVTGYGKTTGDHLVRHPITKLVSLTGSVRAGRELLHAAAENLTVLRLELGGKAPFIVLDDADVEKTVDAAMISRFLNCGQVCTCNERMYVQSGIYDRVVERLLERVGELRVGDPTTDVDLGPKVSRAEVAKVDERVRGAVAAGAEVLAGGHRLADGPFSRGHWYEPTVLAQVDHSMELMRSETFGPVIPLVRFDDFEESVRMANDTSYGLSAYVFSNDLRRVMRVIRDFEFGEIYVNRQLGEAVQGFHTGHGLSGMGGEDGKYGLDGYLQKRTVYLNYS